LKLNRYIGLEFENYRQEKPRGRKNIPAARIGFAKLGHVA
jgi:hypothetical protein